MSDQRKCTARPAAYTVHVRFTTICCAGRLRHTHRTHGGQTRRRSRTPLTLTPAGRNQVTLGTGYGQDYARPDICDYHPQKTAVFLMAIGRLEELCEDLVRRSYPRDTPVAIIENASTPRQRFVRLFATAC